MENRGSIGDLFANRLVVGLSCALLWHFSNIWRYGQYSIQEPNIAILFVETAFLLIVLGFGIWKFASDLRVRKK